MSEDLSVTIWHNPRCSKSRATLELLKERGIDPKVVHYLEDAPAVEELDRVLGMLGLEPRELMRRKEKVYGELDLDDESLQREALLKAMNEHPILIERPVVLAGGKAALGRPPENVLEIID